MSTTIEMSPAASGLNDDVSMRPPLIRFRVSAAMSTVPDRLAVVPFAEEPISAPSSVIVRATIAIAPATPALKMFVLIAARSAGPA